MTLSDNLLAPAADRHWEVGPYEIEHIRLGLMGIDAGALFGIVPRAIWERIYPHVDHHNRLLLGCFAILIRGNGLTIVADSGIGDKISDKMRRNFAVQQVERALPRALQARGIAPEDVTHHIYTHLHFDHCGGATEFGVDGRIRPTFPKARYLVQGGQLAWAANPSDKDKASYLPENWDCVVDAGQLVELSGDTALAPGIDLRVANAHTPGMMMILVSGEGQGILFAIDLFQTSAHLTPHYVPALDNHPLAAIDEKRICLEECHANGWTLVPGHDPFAAPGQVMRSDLGKWSIRQPGESTPNP